MCNSRVRLRDPCHSSCVSRANSEFSRMCTARTLNFELAVLIVIQNLIGDDGGADDEFVILVVKMVHGRCLRSASDI